MTRRALVLFTAAILVLICIAGCKGCKARRLRHKQNEAIYSTQRYTEYIIDSNIVQKELAGDTTLEPYAGDILAFYERRNYQAAWLDGTELTMSAYDFLDKLRLYVSEFGDSSITHGLDDAGVGLMLFSGSAQQRALLDFRLTATFFRYAEKSYGGTTTDLKDLEWYIPRMKKDYLRLLDSLVTSPATYSVYEPVNDYYKALKTALVQYRAIERQGGLPVITVATFPLQNGDSNEAVVQLKKHLALTGDYRVKEMGAFYTDTFANAVRAYQHRMGVRATGRIDSVTLAEINTPISQRLRQIMLNMERLRWMPDSTPSNYILVNIPEYRLHVYEEHKVAWSMDVVVGNSATATSIFTGRLSVVEFGPYWNVPQSIIRNELLPKLKVNPEYLSHMNMEVVSNGTVLDPSQINWHKYTTSVPFVIRQRPGNDNALGLVAFFFPNSFDIFLHDTPAKSFFGENSRAFSHGCIRLAEPEKLADYVLRNDSTDLPKEKIRELMDAHQERKVPVHPSIPVYIVYFTAWVDQSGAVNFRHDIYGHDAKLSKEIFGK